MLITLKSETVGLKYLTVIWFDFVYYQIYMYYKIWLKSNKQLKISDYT